MRCLEIDLQGQLHGTRIGQEELSGLVEQAIRGSQRFGDLLITCRHLWAGGVDVVKGSRSELRVVQDVEGLRLELQNVALGDLNIAEPGALIGFAGPRVIEQTIRQMLPEGFQRSDFLLEKGFLDAVVHRRDLKAYLIRALSLLQG